jgi:hypothetical protein
MRPLLTAALSLMSLLVACAAFGAGDDIVRQIEAEATRVAGAGNGVAAPFDVAQAQQYHDYRVTQEKVNLWEAIVVAALALGSLLVVLRCLIAQPGRTATDIVNATGIIAIVFGTILLTIIADAEAQLTASSGILGAIAGYLFGTVQRRRDPAQAKPLKPD